MGHLTAHYRKFPSEIEAYPNFGELMQVWHAAHFDPKGVTLDSTDEE